MAYATEDIASLAKTGSAIRLGSKVSPSRSLRMARPTMNRLDRSARCATSAKRRATADASRTRLLWQAVPRARGDHGLRPSRLHARRAARPAGTQRHHRRPGRERLPPPACRVPRPDRARGRFRPRGPRGGRHRHRRGLRGRLLGRQLQHPGRARRPRDLRRRERRGPHLRPQARRRLPAARHPDRRHRRVDRRPDDPSAAALGRPGGVERPHAARSGWPRSTSTRPGSGSACCRWRQTAPCRIALVTRMGSGMLPDPEMLFQEGDLLHVLVRDEDLTSVEQVLGRPPELEA